MMNCLSDRFSLRAEADDCQLIVRVDEAEMDEMGRFVGSKKQQRWLWSAIDHRSGKMLADVGSAIDLLLVPRSIIQTQID